MCNPPNSQATFEGQCHLRFDAVRAETVGIAGALTSFNAVLGSSEMSGFDLAGLSGILLDTDRLDGPVACVTINDALRRHTSPKRVTVATGPDAYLDMDGGTDARVLTNSRFVMFCWLPEIYDVGQVAVGTRLLVALLQFLMVEDTFVFLDFGVEDEQEGFVKIFYPGLRELNLELSVTGQFAQGRWRPASGTARREQVIGVIHL